MTKLDIIIPGPEIESDPDANALWVETGNFIGTALARMERGKAFSIMLGRLQHELREAYGAENARKVLQAIMDTME
jgi:hypothetical protein